MQYLGNVTARLEYRVQARCEIDYADYPNASLNTNYAPQSLSSFCIVSRHLKRIFEIERDGNSFCTLKFSRRLVSKLHNRLNIYLQDRKHCCFNLRSSLYRRYIKYFILPGKSKYFLNIFLSLQNVICIVQCSFSDVELCKQNLLYLNRFRTHSGSRNINLISDGISSLDVALIRASWHIDNSWVRKVAADDDFKCVSHWTILLQAHNFRKKHFFI